MILRPDRPTRQRPVPVGWQAAPLDMQQVGFKAMLVLHLPVRVEFLTEHRRNEVAQRVAQAALNELQVLEEMT